MKVNVTSRAAEIVRKDQTTLLEDWLTELRKAGGRGGRLTEAEVRGQAEEFLRLLGAALDSPGRSAEPTGPEWAPVRDFLSGISRSRSEQGFTPSQTATFVFSLKQPLFARLRAEIGTETKDLVDEIWRANILLDQLGLFTTEVFQKSREEIINRQQQEMLELSTPVVKLWDGVLGLPMIGTLDSARTQVVMESLLQRIVETNSQLAIIDITGVPTVDTLVAQHLLKTVAAAKLMGTEVIISGVRPQIAQTIVHLGVDLGQVITKSSLSDAFALALHRLGLTVTRERRA